MCSQHRNDFRLPFTSQALLLRPTLLRSLAMAGIYSGGRSQDNGNGYRARIHGLKFCCRFVSRILYLPHAPDIMFNVAYLCAFVAFACPFELYLSLLRYFGATLNSLLQSAPTSRAPALSSP